MIQTEVLIVGGGIGGLTLALSLHQAGIGCRVYEAVAELRPLGVGINLLPHAVREFAELGLEQALAQVAVTTRESAFFNRFGQLIYREPAGRFAGYDWPQFSIHRGDLQTVLLDAVRARLGADAIVTGHRCAGVDPAGDSVTVRFVDGSGAALEPVRAGVAIGCDGLHSALRAQLYPGEGAPRYSGVNMWRGVTRWPPILSGASMIRAGWLSHGKMVIYPIRDSIDSHGRQLVNWVAEMETPNRPAQRDWNRTGVLDDFLPAFADWHFDWLDVPAFIRAADAIYEFPMVDQDPLPRWSFDRVSLLGDAAHPMYPRGSNGSNQAVLDARCLAGALKRSGVGPEALEAYDSIRVKQTGEVVLMNRTNPPDAIIREVMQRTGDRPFEAIGDVIAQTEMAAMLERYKQVSGSSIEALRERPSFI